MSKRKGFTLIELVVVIMIIAILGATAAPRLMGTRQTAVDSGLIKTLASVRNAVSIYASENGGTLPGADGNQATFVTDLTQYLRGPFPGCTVGNATNPADVRMVTLGNAPLVGDPPTPAEGWAYNVNTGEFIANFNGNTVTNPAMTYDQL